MTGGSAENALIAAGCAQMARFYDLPGSVAAGMTDSKLPDAQAGSEKAYGATLAANAGASLICEAAGMQASLLSTALEAYVIDDDMLGAVQRTVRGIEVTEDSISLEVMRSVCIGGPGHYLGHAQTLGLMQTEYVYPHLGDRTSPKEWAERGKPDLLERAVAKKQEILATRSAARFDAATDAAIRARFNIHLPN
jgi:trimethylamine--corrinoid protein Co-methyltransferase